MPTSDAANWCHGLQAERVARALSRDEKRKQRLKAAKIDYEYTPLSSALEKKAKKTKDVSEKLKDGKKVKSKSKMAKKESKAKPVQ